MSSRTSRAGWRRGPCLALRVLLLLALAGCAGRISAAEAERIAELLALRPGMRVADVGAGDGRWAADLARRVGGTGRVWATEVDPEEVEKIRRRRREEGLEQLEVVEGDQRATGLGPACCDAVLLRLVYHHFTDPVSMRADLLRALRPGGLLAVIDIRPQKHWRRLSGVPERGGHGIEPDELIAELTAAGFELVGRHDEWEGGEDRYCVVFRRPGTEPEVGPEARPEAGSEVAEGF